MNRRKDRLKPISLYGITPEDALRKAMEAPIRTEPAKQPKQKPKSKHPKAKQ